MRIPYKCPICEGRGIVAGGFYNSVGNEWTAGNAAEPCRQCNGEGIIWVTELPETLSYPDELPSSTIKKGGG